MGYTHYFGLKQNHKISTRKLLKEVNEVLKEHSNIIQFEYDIKKPAQCEVNRGEILIRFNGIGDDGHETFYFNSSEQDFEGFCKTSRKDYDLVVCKVLVILKAYYGDAMSLTSDGFYGYQPKNKQYEINDVVRYEDMDENWGDVVRDFNTTSDIKFEFKVIGTHGDNNCYFKVSIEESNKLVES